MGNRIGQSDGVAGQIQKGMASIDLVFRDSRERARAVHRDRALGQPGRGGAGRRPEPFAVGISCPRRKRSRSQGLSQGGRCL